MALTANDILIVVKVRLQLTDASLDTLVTSYIDEIGQRILHYCNLSEVPDGLRYTWVAMVLDALRIEQSQNPAIAATVVQEQAIKLGDTSVSPAQVDGVTSTNKSVIDSVVLNYKVDLNKYRRLGW